jgi:uncharacterized Tic20 family protein
MGIPRLNLDKFKQIPDNAKQAYAFGVVSIIISLLAIVMVLAGTRAVKTAVTAGV